MFRKDPIKEMQNRQYVDDLVLLSGGLPRNGIVQHLGFYAVVFMNGVLYEPDKAHMLAEHVREGNRRRESGLALNC